MATPQGVVFFISGSHQDRIDAIVATSGRFTQPLNDYPGDV